jgi:hypothetical protein
LIVKLWRKRFLDRQVVGKNVHFLPAIVVEEKNDLFCDHALLSPTNICGLHCGMGVIDCVSCQAYNVCVIMASCERCPHGGAEERIACPRGEGEAPAMGSIQRGRVRPTATGYK